jgi:hypothetical protein
MSFFRSSSSSSSGPSAAAASGVIPIPFRKVLLAGDSDFEIPVHRSFCRDRSFSFSALSVVPGYFEQQAAQLDMETDVELDAETTEFVDCRAGRLHQIKDIMEGPDPDNERTFAVDTFRNLNSTSDYVDAFNNFFLTNKPPHLKAPAFFMDWMDSRYFGKPSEELEAFVKANFAHYYEATEEVKEWTAGIHNLGLPAGLRDLPDANGLNFPRVPFAPEIFGRIYLRLHLAPMTKLVCSTANLFNYLGFDVERERARNTGDHHNQIVFLNDTNVWKMIRAARPMPQHLTRIPVKHRIRMGHARNEVGAAIAFQLPERAGRRNAALLSELEPLFMGITEMTNIKFGIEYLQDVAKFKINFPPEIASRVMMSPHLQNRLGLGSDQAVVVTTESQTRPDPESKEKTDSLTMARALVLDTGISICTPARGVTSSGMFLADNFMAMLHPTLTGTLETKDFRPGPIILDDDLRYGSDNVARLQFRLHRFLNNGDIVPFGWKTSSYVTGILLCTPK